ncbi:MAG TPA: hypothetical protein VGB14_11055 [Acidimicrobiales bacterium]|jgi:hypothetical protein
MPDDEPHGPRPRPEQQLVRFLTLVERVAHARGWGAPAQLVRIDPDDGDEDGVAVAVLPLPAGSHPEVALLGLRAPRSWPTLGLVAEGDAAPVGAVPGTGCRPTAAGRDGGPFAAAPTPVAPGAPPPGAPASSPRCRPSRQRSAPDRGHRRRVRVALLAARSGTVVSRVRVAGDPPVVAVHRPGEAPTGRLVDLLLRALDVPTPPPPPTTTELWARLWLDAVATATPAPATWDAAAALHPALPAAGPSHASPDALAEAGAVAGALMTWERLRRDAAGGTWTAPRLTAADAGWMDAGGFARWVLAELPALDTLAAAVRSRVPPDVADGVTAVLDRCGLG